MTENDGGKYQAFFISQETLDRLLDGFDAHKSVDHEDVDAADERTEAAAISQSDIDQLLVPDADGTPQALETSQNGEEPGLVSQSA